MFFTHKADVWWLALWLLSISGKSIIWAPILPQPDRHCEAQLNKQVFHVLTMDTTLKVVQSLETKRQAIIGKQS